MNIREIKTRVHEMLDATYRNEADAKPVDNIVRIEEEGFLRVQDAVQIAKTCTDKQLFVSFRAAGRATLDKINKGCPCKGHKIMDKSIKESGGRWTYIAPVNPLLGATPEAVLASLKGFVGHPYIPRNEDGSVDFESADRPPVRIYRPDGTVDRVIYHLDGIYVLPQAVDPKAKSACEFAILDAATITDQALNLAYTGDYDMHDLIWKGVRPSANSPEELSSIDYLNSAILKKDVNRAENVKLGKSERYHKSPYALIRHGAQTAFFDYLTTDKGEAELKEKLEENLRAIGTENYVSRLPFGNLVVKIDEHIAMFDDKGKAYLLNGVGAVYNFYLRHKLLDQIPFYNFFEALHGITAYKKEIEEFAAYINTLLSVNLKVIDRSSDYPWRG